MHWINNNNLEIIFSYRQDGDMFFKVGEDILNEKVKENRKIFFKKHNIDSARVVNIAGAHSNNIFLVKEEDAGKGSLDEKTRIKNSDGLITNVENMYLMVTGADCFPIFFYDEKNHAVGIVHAGWKGILNGISVEMVEEFKTKFGSVVSDLKVWIGPGIQKCHFEVKAAPEGSEPRPESSGREDVVKLFSEKYPQYVIKKDDKVFVDLPAVIKAQLVENGIDFQNITQHSDCTFCDKNRWSSYRRDNPKNVEASAFIIGLKNS